MHEPPPIKGYQPISDERLSLVNENKVAEANLLAKLDEMSFRVDLDIRWLGIARTHIEQGFMALNRSILRPQRVKEGDSTGRSFDRNV